MMDGERKWKAGSTVRLGFANVFLKDLSFFGPSKTFFNSFLYVPFPVLFWTSETSKKKQSFFTKFPLTSFFVPLPFSLSVHLRILTY